MVKKSKSMTSIRTAPVSIGNTVRGSKATTKQIKNGLRVVGRDFAFALSGSASTVTSWAQVGGMPITPSVLTSSNLRSFCQMYAFFKINKIKFHYITSSPTSQAGDILFYYARTNMAPNPDTSNSGFLPFVLSDPNTTIGPQWSNAVMDVIPVNDWKSTDYANSVSDIDEVTAGVLNFYSKTNATSSPGYVLMEYDISFKELSVNPRAGQLPVIRGQISQICLNLYATVTQYSAVWLGLGTNDVSGVAAALPSGTTAGDIFRFVLNASASGAVISGNTVTGTPTPTLANILFNSTSSTAGIGNAITLDDGFVLYLRYGQGAGTFFGAYATLQAAQNGASGTGLLQYATTITTPSYPLVGTVQLVTANYTQTQSSY